MSKTIMKTMTAFENELDRSYAAGDMTLQECRLARSIYEHLYGQYTYLDREEDKLGTIGLLKVVEALRVGVLGGVLTPITDDPIEWTEVEGVESDDKRLQPTHESLRLPILKGRFMDMSTATEDMIAAAGTDRSFMAVQSIEPIEGLYTRFRMFVDKTSEGKVNGAYIYPHAITFEYDSEGNVNSTGGVGAGHGKGGDSSFHLEPSTDKVDTVFARRDFNLYPFWIKPENKIKMFTHAVSELSMAIESSGGVTPFDAVWMNEVLDHVRLNVNSSAGQMKPMVNTIYNELMNGKPLTPLSGDTDEWELVKVEGQDDVTYRNKRCKEVYVRGVDDTHPEMSLSSLVAAGKAYDTHGAIVHLNWVHDDGQISSEMEYVSLDIHFPYNLNTARQEMVLNPQTPIHVQHNRYFNTIVALQNQDYLDMFLRDDRENIVVMLNLNAGNDNGRTWYLDEQNNIQPNANDSMEFDV